MVESLRNTTAIYMYVFMYADEEQKDLERNTTNARLWLPQEKGLQVETVQAGKEDISFVCNI